MDADGFAGSGRGGFNQRVNEGFESIRDYVVAHYVMNSRDDTDYWRQNGENKNVPDPLRQILDIWKSAKNLNQEMERQQIRSSYRPMSWYCLLAGYGFYPELRPMPADNLADKKIDMGEIDDFVQRCSLNFRSQNEQLRFGPA